MAKVIINRENCKGCLLCLEVCPRKILVRDAALNLKGVNPVKVTQPSLCIGCAMCAIICPDCCIEVFK